MGSGDETGRCGPWESGLNRWLPQGPLEGACAVHDRDSTDPPTGMTRRAADAEFGRNLARAAYGGWWIVAGVYWVAVRALGWLYWRGGGR